MDKTQQLIQAAHQLFEQQGFHATGVDQIAKHAGVTKRTLYKQFGSKEKLIATVLKEHHILTMLAICNHVEAGGEGDSPEAQLMRCFDSYREWFARKDFAGCIYIKTLNEFSGCSTELCAVAQQCKQAIRDYIGEITAKGDFADPETLADQLQLLLEGSIVVTQYNTKHDPIETARAIASNLIASARRSA